MAATILLLPLRCVLALTLFTVRANAVAIDNGVFGTPVVNCAMDSIEILFATEQPFSGRIFVKGFAYTSGCSRQGSGSQTASFLLSFNQCGVRRTRQISGLGISATVVISFHPFFLTKVDRAYRVNCFYMQAEKRVSQELLVSMITTAEISRSLPMPVCRYDILRGSSQGSPVRFVRIGDAVYHKWSCTSDSPGTYCMRVHSCTVDDGQGANPFQVLDNRGCSVDRFLLQNLDYLTDLMAGQEAHVFKFADRPALFFNCQIELRLKDQTFGCTRVQPSCLLESTDPNGIEYSAASSAALRRQRRNLPAENHTDIVADFDLPEQKLVVFDIEDASSGAAGQARSRQEQVLADEAAGFLLEAPTDTVCLTPSKFAGLAMALALVTSLGAFVILLVFMRRKSLAKQFNSIVSPT